VCHNHKIYFLKEKKRKLLRKAAWQKTKRKRNKCRRLARQRIIGEAQQMPCHYAVVFWFFLNQALVEAAYLAAFFLVFFKNQGQSNRSRSRRYFIYTGKRKDKVIVLIKLIINKIQDL
jgi:hypothetical protein